MSPKDTQLEALVEALIEQRQRMITEAIPLRGISAPGALERAIFAGALLALEFGIYEALKAGLHISKDDFAYSLDVLATATAALPPPSVLPR